MSYLSTDPDAIPKAEFNIDNQIEYLDENDKESSSAGEEQWN